MKYIVFALSLCMSVSSFSAEPVEKKTPMSKEIVKKDEKSKQSLFVPTPGSSFSGGSASAASKN